MNYKVGLIYWGSKEPFCYVEVSASSTKAALNIAVNYLKPNHLQTLKIIS